MEQNRINKNTNNTEIDSIDIRDIIHLLIKWWWRIAIFMIIFSVLAYFYTMYSYVPTYTATATLIVNSKQIKIEGQQVVTSNDIYLSQKLVNTYSLILKSNRLMELVIQDLKLDFPPSLLRGLISVTTMKDTEVLYIAVNNPDPELAAKIANSIMKVAPAVISETVEVGSVKVVDYAKIPKYPLLPHPFRNAGIGALLGAMLGVGLAFLLKFLDNTVKNIDDIREKIDIPVLGGIPYIKPQVKAGKIFTPIINERSIEHGFKEAYKALRTNLQFASAVKDAKKIIITSALNREGKSTIAINISIALAQTGKSVLLIGCDLRKPSIIEKLGLKVEKGKGLTSILVGDYSAKECIFNHVKSGIDILPCGRIAPNPSELLGSEKMGKILGELEQEYDYIIMDTPPTHLVTDAIALAKYADGVIVVIKQSYSSFEIVNSSMDELIRVNANILGCILNSIKYKEAGVRYKYLYQDKYYRSYYGGYSNVNLIEEDHSDLGHDNNQESKLKDTNHVVNKKVTRRLSSVMRQFIMKVASGWAFIALTLAGLAMVVVALWGYFLPLYNSAKLFVQPASAESYLPQNNSLSQVKNNVLSGVSYGNSWITNAKDDTVKVYPKYGEQYATLLIPAEGINRPVYFGDSRSQLTKGVGHYSGSYFPGEGGTIIYAGHNDVVFKKLENVKKGDEVLVQTNNSGNFRYRVYDIQRINGKDTKYIDSIKDKEVLVMYTCYPFNNINIGFKTERYVVFAEPIEEN